MVIKLTRDQPNLFLKGAEDLTQGFVVHSTVGLHHHNRTRLLKKIYIYLK